MNEATVGEATEKAAGITIHEMANQNGMSVHTLRYYERIGLLAPIARDASSRHRRYAPGDVALVESLACLRGTGMSIGTMKDYLRLLERGSAASAEQKSLFVAHREVLLREMERMRERLAYIDGKISFWEAVEAGNLKEAERIAGENKKLAKLLT